MPPPTDIDLITRAQNDSRKASQSAYAELVRRHSPALLRYLTNLLPSQDQAEEIAQEAFLAAWQQRARFDGRRGSFAAWLFTIARNRAYNCLRGNGRLATEMFTETTPADQPGPDRVLSVRQAYAALDLALAQLPFTQRSVYVLAEIQGLSMAEIAAIEALPVGTVKSRLARARRKLKGRLKQIGDLLDG